MSRRRADSGIPYDRFEEAIAKMRERFPEAVDFKPNFYMRRISIEVRFRDGTGRVVPAHEE